MRRPSCTRAAICAGLLLSFPATALGAPAEPAAQRGESDRAFLKQALGMNELELRLGRLAVERATTSDVKEMGKKMVQKHSELGQQLSSLAKQSGTSGNARLSQDQEDTYARVRSQSGSEFDRVFKQTVDDGHVSELAMYQEAVGRVANPELRALAEQRVAALQKSMTIPNQAKEAKQQ